MHTISPIPTTILPPAVAARFAEARAAGVDIQEYLTDLQIAAWNNRTGDLQHYDCPLCKNRGDIAYKTDGGLFALRQCSCIVQRRAYARAIKSGMADLLDKTFKGFEVKNETQRKLHKTGTDYWQAIKAGERKWMCLLGQSGCGKTHICSAIVNNLIKAGYDCRYMMWTHEIGELKRSATEREQYNAMYNELLNAPVLYIDDLFKGAVTVADKRITFDIINYRANSRLITLVSSELYLREIAQVDSAIAGRLNEMSKPFIAEIYRDENKNYRLRG